MAVSATAFRKLPYEGELIDLLASDAELRNEVHQALVEFADGADLGPAPDADNVERAAAATRWKLWQQWKKRPETKRVLSGLASADSNERWVAAALARQESLNQPKVLIQMLSDDTPGVRRECLAALALQLEGDELEAVGEATAANIVCAVVAKKVGAQSELIELLDEPDPKLRDAVHKGLVQCADGLDIGPRGDRNAANTAAAIELWKTWWKWRNSTDSQPILAGMSGDNAEERLIAAALARQRRLDVPQLFIESLGHESSFVRQECHSALVALATGAPDYGPVNDADEATIAAAQQKWTDWFAERDRKVAAAKVAAREKMAAARLSLAKKLSDAGRDEQAQERYESIARDYPDTISGAEAARLAK